jgi:hypothetical protein
MIKHSQGCALACERVLERAVPIHGAMPDSDDKKSTPMTAHLPARNVQFGRLLPAAAKNW